MSGASAAGPVSMIDAWLRDDRPLLLDGALATELERRGADLRDPLWSARLLIEAPDLIRQVHLDYYLAGADVATTASYQASFEGFAQRGLDAAAAASLMRRSVQLAQEARAAFWGDPANRAGRRRPLVAASVGPYGAMLADGSEYRGHYGLTPAALVDFHRARVRSLLEAGPDLLACETLPSLDEALALATLLREFPAARAWVSFSCRDGRHTCEGQDIGDCARALAGFEQVVAVGVNCTAPEHVDSLVERLRAASGKPIVVYPNSGETYDAVSKRWHGHAERPFAQAAQGWGRSGARLVGGCCRTAPSDIAALRALLVARPAAA